MSERKRIDMRILRSFEVEVQTKYVYLCLLMEMSTVEENYIEIPTELFCINCGISQNRFYRARANLIKMNVISLTKSYCDKTGRKISDYYELI